ncbi:MAG: hypothetical protein Q9176_007541 [Flavoplaca citrina]
MVLIVQATSAAIRYIRGLDGPGSSDKRSSQPHRDIGALTYSVFQLEHALILSLFAEFVLATKFFNLILFQPFPTIAQILLQIGLLLIAEELFRVWVYKALADWAPAPARRSEPDVAVVLPAEYVIPKATIGLVMLEICAVSYLGVPLPSLHFTAILTWTGLRQWGVFKYN